MLEWIGPFQIRYHIAWPAWKGRMFAERWSRIESLFHEALGIDSAERASFLDQVCSGDRELRQEIESLLSYEALANDFMESSDSYPSSEPPPRDPIQPGERIGPYTVFDALGSGGMGEVYRARDERLERDVALKFISHRFAEGAAALDRFEREARAASALNHPNICTVYDVGESRGRPYLVLELLDGESLKDRLFRSPLQLEEILSIARQVSAALDAAHSKGIVHRDIKPANIFVTSAGHVKVLDFGLAKKGDDLYGSDIEASRPALGLTASGMIMGTLAYMSPEQAVGAEVDARSDLFSLGVVLYEMTTGKHPFRGQTPAGILGSILTESPSKPSAINSKIPAALDRVILNLLAKDPADRFRSAAELDADLSRVAHRAARSSTTIWIAACAALLAFVVALSASSWLPWFAAGSPGDLVSKQVTANPPEDPIMQAALSPDGRTVAYGDFTGIHLRNIDTGETRAIPPPANYCFR